MAALDATSHIHVGLGLMPAPLRNAALVAMEIAALSRLHPGRFTPAVGHGVPAWMAKAGVSVDSPLTLVREYATAVRRLLHGEEVTVSGRYVRLDSVRLSLPPRPGRVPPLLVGANGPKTLRLAGEVADGVILGEASSADAVEAAVALVRLGRSQSPLEQDFLHVVGYVEPEADPVTQAVDLVSAGLTTIVFTTWDGDPNLTVLIKAAQSARDALIENGATS